MQEVIRSLISEIPTGDTYQIKIDGRDNYRFEGVDPENVIYIVK
jgi:hypothetical protein